MPESPFEEHHMSEQVKLSAADSRTHYDPVAMGLHWLTVALVLLQFGSAELWGYFPRPTKHVMILGHMSFGILLAAAIVLRIIWRFMPGHRVAPANSGFLEAASKVVHSLLYVLLVTQAVLGFLLRWGGNEAMVFFGLQIPAFFPPFEKPVRHLIGQAHATIGWTIILLAAGHAIAALVHHFILRDNVLRRMLPGRRADEQTAPN
jgi:cytochrome b561